MNHDMKNLPLVSCIMPTANRRRFVPQAIKYFQAQDYANKELVILDDGADSVAALIPDDPQIRYVRLTGKRTLGAKRNECVEESRGDLIMHWDDDDWHAPHRISYQLETMLEAGADVCGLQQMLYYELTTGRAWLYKYPTYRRPWLAGNSLLYTREFWRRAPFPDIQVASDTRFIFHRRLDKFYALPDYKFYVAMIHSENVSPKKCTGTFWSRWSGDLPDIIGEDWACYRSILQKAHPARITTMTKTSFAIKGNKNQSALPAASDTKQRATIQNREQGGYRMRIGYILSNFPPLSETFIRREILALCQAGHKVFVYTQYLHRDPLVPEMIDPHLVVRQVSFHHSVSALAEAVQADSVENLHASLMLSAQRVTYQVARTLQIPFTLTVYSGHDVFTAQNPNLYRDISADPLCVAIIVEDAFMQAWVVNRLGADSRKIVIIPNSFDLELYRLREPRPQRERIAILAIARFVEKKGLIYLVRAFNQLCTQRHQVELWLVGDGPERAKLRHAAGRNQNIKFIGCVSESQTRQLYVDADVFCLPCIRTARGDADGVPTTILEAMAFELPVIGSNLLSTPHYVRDGKEGLLTAPGNVSALTAALETLGDDTGLRNAMGGAGRVRISELCDLKRNIVLLQNIMMNGRRRRWGEMITALESYRKTYTNERKTHYAECKANALQYFKIQGRLLDIGCGHGDVRFHVSTDVHYIGCDPLLTEPVKSGFPFLMAYAEALPFRGASFDSALIYSVLPNVFDVDAVLAEAMRILKPGGHLFLRECINDPNPIHLNHLTDSDLQRRVSQHGHILRTHSESDRMLLIHAQKPEKLASKAQAAPLVSIAITAYNREEFIRACIDSALNQTHQPIEVVVVDDGSTDGTRSILQSFGSAIRVAYNGRNRGIAFSKNRALKMSSPSAQYVAILDSDDYFHPNFVERCVAFLENNPDIGLVYTDDILIDIEGRLLSRRRAVHPWSVERWLCTCNLRGDTWMARRDLILKTKLHDEALTHDVDYDLFYQLLRITEFAHLSEYLVYYRQHDRQSAADELQLAKCHAANLIRYGYSRKYAYMRAERNPEWIPAIEEGIALGKQLKEHRGQNSGSKRMRIEI